MGAWELCDLKSTEIRDSANEKPPEIVPKWKSEILSSMREEKR